MNVRIGTDLVDIERFRALVQKDAFVRKVFTDTEIAQCQNKAHPEASFAARFAAKEAFFKALGTGLYAQGMGPHDVWVECAKNGRPQLRVSGKAKQQLDALAGSWTMDVSLAHDGEMASASVVILLISEPIS